MLAIRRSAVPWYRTKIGSREVVGPSITGVDIYFDRPEAPCPPIRWQRPSPEVDALFKKEKGPWTALTLDEKKKLYRANFRQTFAEMEAPTCEWKRIWGNALFLASVPILLFVVMKKTIFPPLPETMSDLGKKKVVRYYIDNRVDPMPGGLTSKWDYEKQQWKEKPFLLMKKD